MHKYALFIAALLSLSGIVYAAGDKPGAPQPPTMLSPAATMARANASKLAEAPRLPDVCPAGWKITLSGKPGVYECVRQTNVCPPNYENPKAFVGAGEGYYSCSPAPMPVTESPPGWHCSKKVFNGEAMALCQPLLVPGLPENAQLPCVPSTGSKLGTEFYAESYKKMGCRAASKPVN
jgi:hypothetical protein